MTNHEQAPNSTGDRLNPPLHPSNPKYAPEVIDAKMAIKHQRMNETKDTFDLLHSQGAKLENLQKKLKRHEKIDYSDNLTGYGYWVKDVDAPIKIQHTEQNDIFFVYNHQQERFELIYQGSAEIVGILEIAKTARAANLPNRPLAFFDSQGTFYDQVIFKDLHLDPRKNGYAHEKHTAYFEIKRGKTFEELAIPIDDIHCVSLAVQPAPNGSTNSGQDLRSG